MTERILRCLEVEAIIGLGRSAIYAWVAAGDFPKPIALGERLVTRRECDVTAWLNGREPKAV